MPVEIQTQLIDQERERRLSVNRLRYFEPNGAVEKFINLFGTSDNLVYILAAANGIGKTASVVNILGNVVFGAQNKYFNYEIFKRWPYPKRARYITNSKNVEEIGPFHSEVEKWWPKGRYEAIKAGHNYFSQYKANGWVIDVMTFDQEASQFEGANIGLIVVDEPMPRSLWTPNVSRLRAGGRMIVPMTPLTDAGWFFDEIVPRHQNYIVTAGVEEACKQHGKNGHLEHKQIEQMIAEYQPEDIEARVHGKALYLAGLIYKMFDQRVHVLKTPVQVPSGMNVYQAVDPHSDKPFACVWGFPDTNGDVYIVDEWPNEDFYKMHNCQLTITDYRNIFADKEQGWNVSRRIIDRHFADVRSAINKRTLREELRDEAGLDYSPSYVASEEIETGILRVREYLKYNQSQPINNLNKPRLFINPHCKNTIKSFQRWSRDAKNGKVKDDYKDFMDAVRYLLMDNPKIDNDVPAPVPAQKRW